MSTARVHPEPRRTKEEAAKELLRIAEENMDGKGLSEEDKNSRRESFIAYVDSVNADRAR